VERKTERQERWVTSSDCLLYGGSRWAGPGLGRVGHRRTGYRQALDIFLKSDDRIGAAGTYHQPGKLARKPGRSRRRRPVALLADRTESIGARGDRSLGLAAA
jgi:hypothetical protein